MRTTGPHLINHAQKSTSPLDSPGVEAKKGRRTYQPLCRPLPALVMDLLWVNRLAGQELRGNRTYSIWEQKTGNTTDAVLGGPVGSLPRQQLACPT